MEMRVSIRVKPRISHTFRGPPVFPRWELCGRPSRPDAERPGVEVHLLKYKFSQGDTLTYDQSTVASLKQPEGQDLVATTEIEMVQKVAEDHGDNWTLNAEVKTLKTEGALPEDAAAPAEISATIRMDQRGSNMEIDPALPASRMPVFPGEVVGVGDTWIAKVEGSEQEVHYQLEKFEHLDGDVVAHIVSWAGYENEELGYSSQAASSVQFSINQGHQLGSKTVIRRVFKDGRVNQNVLNLKLRERT